MAKFELNPTQNPFWKIEPRGSNNVDTVTYHISSTNTKFSKEVINLAGVGILLGSNRPLYNTWAYIFKKLENILRSWQDQVPYISKIATEPW